MVLPQQAESVLEYLGAWFSLSQFCTLFQGLSLLACSVAKQEGMVCNFVSTNYFHGQQMAKFSENCAILHGDQPCNQAGYFDFYQVLRYICITGWKVMNLGKKVPLSLVHNLECSNSIVLLRSQRKFGPLFVA